MKILDSRFHGNDKKGHIVTFYDFIFSINTVTQGLHKP